RPVCFGGETDKLALCLSCSRVIYVLEIGGLATQTRSVIDNLAVYFPRGVINERQGSFPSSLVESRFHRGRFLFQLNRASISSSVISAKGESMVIPIFRSRSIFASTESKIMFISAVARLTLSLTSPRLERSSKITTRITRDATIEMWMLSRSPSC